MMIEQLLMQNFTAVTAEWMFRFGQALAEVKHMCLVKMSACSPLFFLSAVLLI